jgi:hypothetical protein
MDLVALVTLCAIGVEPKLMHAVVWHQSAGDPWSFSVPGEADRRVYRTLDDAVTEARRVRLTNSVIRVGLAGLPVEPMSATAAVFMPCPNITSAAQQITDLAEHCKTVSGLPGDRTLCAVAAYHGTWQRPDTRFAAAVIASVQTGDAPNFDMPNETKSEPNQVPGDPPAVPRKTGSLTSGPPSDDSQAAWSSALFPTTKRQPNDAWTGESGANHPADDPHPSRAWSVDLTTKADPRDGLFVLRSSHQERQ